jgi:hypothetical protein
MFKKAVDLFPSCAPLLRSFAAYCDNGKSRSLLLVIQNAVFVAEPCPVAVLEDAAQARSYRARADALLFA